MTEQYEKSKQPWQLIKEGHEADFVKPYWPPVQEAIDEYLDGYELDDGQVNHTPNEIESLLIEDAIAGLLNDERFMKEYGSWLDTHRRFKK